MRMVVLLSRRHRLFAAAAGWKVPGVELFLFDSPSEALAKLSLGHSAVFVFDTRDYPRHRHVVRKFLSMKVDADLVLVGGEDVNEDGADGAPAASVTALPETSEPAEIFQTIERHLRLRRVRESSGIVGRSAPIQEVLSLVAHAAPLDVNILILGESGTGKELVARAIHDNSRRAAGPFVSLNCGAMSEGVLESELFGHARGAFTGAVTDHEGVFRRADNGTLFLDEVAEMPLGMQTRFLRALETGEFTPVGGRAPRTSNIRLVAATHRNLADDVARGRFRQDLYFRLRVVVIQTPPLRAHREDIPILASTFLRSENEKHGLHVRGLTRAAEQALLEMDWPGNVRELRNLISSAVVMKQNGLIDVEDLPGGAPAAGGSRSYLPVALGAAVAPELDMAMFASTLLAIRQEIRELRTLLTRQAPPADLAGGWHPADTTAWEPATGVVETFGGADAYSPLSSAAAGDLQTAERTLVEAALRTHAGNRRKAAERLGISERTLYRKIRAYGL
ncbi:MAG: sigma-54-dependent Fis family transcriptional regulator [bacterium]|nr:sigma-54-dependent Fis family transcriptional regulator [bacterium]